MTLAPSTVTESVVVLADVGGSVPTKSAVGRNGVVAVRSAAEVGGLTAAVPVLVAVALRCARWCPRVCRRRRWRSVSGRVSPRRRWSTMAHVFQAVTFWRWWDGLRPGEADHTSVGPPGQARQRSRLPTYAAAPHGRCPTHQVYPDLRRVSA